MNKLFFLLNIAFLLFLLAVPAGAKEPPPNLSEQLVELKNRLREEEADQIREKIEAYNRRKDLEARVRKLDREWDELQIKVIGRQNQVTEIEEENYRLAQELEKLEGDFAEIRKAVAGRVDRLNSLPGALYPYYREEKLGLLQNLSQDLNSGAPEIVRDLEELLALYRREIEIGETIEFYSEAGGKEVIRLGRVASISLSPEGEKVGILLRKDNQYIWEDQLDAETAGRIKTVIEKIRARERGLTGIPLDVTLGRRSKAVEPSAGLTSFFVKGGPIMVPLFLLGLAAFIMIGMRFFAIRKNEIDGEELMGRVSGLLAKREHERIDQILDENPVPLSRMLRAGLARFGRGKEAVEEAMDNSVAVDLPGLEKFLSAIAVLGSISPLLGLLGTVSGMINTFDVITRFGSGDPKLLSGGISEALITTEVGLSIAIPVLLLHNHLSNRIRRIAADLEKYRAQFLNFLFP